MIKNPIRITGPLRRSLQDYERVLEETVRFARKSPLVRTILQVGTCHHPGISDIDLLVVTESGITPSELVQWRSELKRFLEERREFFLHEPVYVEASDVQDLVSFRCPLFKDLCGAVVLYGPPAFESAESLLTPSEEIGIVFFKGIHFTMKDLLYLREATAGPIWDGRYLMVLLKSIGLTLKYMRDFLNIPLDETFESEVADLRTGWFDRSPEQSRKALIDLCERAQRLLIRIFSGLGGHRPVGFLGPDNRVPLPVGMRRALPRVEGIEAVWFERVSPFLEYQRLIFTSVPDWTGRIITDRSGGDDGLAVPAGLFPFYFQAAADYEEIGEPSVWPPRTFSGAGVSAPAVWAKVPPGYARCMRLMKKLHNVYYADEDQEVFSRWSRLWREARGRLLLRHRVRRIRRQLDARGEVSAT